MPCRVNLVIIRVEETGKIGYAIGNGRGGNLNYYEDDYCCEQQVDEAQHVQAMLFKAQCLWRNYEDMVSRPHNEDKTLKLLFEIDVLEANLRERGFYECA